MARGSRGAGGIDLRALSLALFLVLAPLAHTPAAQATGACPNSPVSYQCVGDFDMGDDAPGCGLTIVYVWVQSGTSATVWGMGCENGYRANGAGGTVANTTAVGMWWPSTECLQVFVVDYTSYTWYVVPVCEAGAPPPDPGYGHLLP